MAHTHKRGTTYTTDATTVLSASQTFTANTTASFSQAVPDGTTNLVFTVGFPTDDLIACLLSSDQAVTLKVNSSGSPTPTIALAANVPLTWTNTDLAANPFTTSPVTQIFITNASGSTANVELDFLIDSD